MNLENKAVTVEYEDGTNIIFEYCTMEFSGNFAMFNEHGESIITVLPLAKIKSITYA